MANNILQTTSLIEKLNAILSENSALLDKAAASGQKYSTSLKPSDFSKATQEQNKAQKETIRLEKELIRTKKQAERERLRELKMHSKRERAMDKYERQLQREQRALNRNSGLYNRIQRGVTSVSRAYNDLAAKKALDGKLSKEQEIQLTRLEAKLQKYQGVLKKVDSNIGKYNRNVGNYASGWNGLGNSINQLTREAPAFANSVQTGFMALSNNIPILTDEIGRLISANKLLQAEGKPTTSVFRQIMKSVFSLQTAMSVGITLLVLYGKEIGEWAESVFGGASAADRMAENTKKLNEESAKLSSQTIPQFQALVQIAQDVTETEERRSDAIKELNEQYPDFNANILTEKDNTELVNDAIDSYVSKLHQKAMAQASMTMMQEKYNELITAQRESEELLEAVNKGAIGSEEERLELINKLSEASSKFEQRNKSRTASERVGFNAAREALGKYNNAKEKESLIQDEINNLMQVYIDNVDLSKAKTKENTESKREQVKALDSEIEVTALLRKELEAQITLFTTLAGMYAEGTALNIEYTKRVNDLKIALGELNAIGLIKVEIDYDIKSDPNANPTDAITPDGDKVEGEWKDTFQSVTDVARRAFGIITALSDASFQRQFDNLEKQKNAALEFAGDSAVARENIERQYDEKRRKIQQRQAKAKKEQAIFDILIDTASAVVRALPNIPLSIAVGVLGAAQLALVASQQVPQFWQGGEVGGSQQIMVNDDPYGKKGRNYKEVIEKPNGQILTPQGKNVKMTVPKGTIVHPTYDAFMNSLDTELLNNNIMPVGSGNIMPMIINQGLSKSDVLEVMNNHANRLVSTINGQKGISINIDENGINKYVTKKGHTSKIMNARYSGKGISV